MADIVSTGCKGEAYRHLLLKTQYALAELHLEISPAELNTMIL
jgi:hypothetical protein